MSRLDLFEPRIVETSSEEPDSAFEAESFSSDSLTKEPLRLPLTRGSWQPVLIVVGGLFTWTLLKLWE